MCLTVVTIVPLPRRLPHHFFYFFQLALPLPVCSFLATFLDIAAVALQAILTSFSERDRERESAREMALWGETHTGYESPVRKSQLFKRKNLLHASGTGSDCGAALGQEQIKKPAKQLPQLKHVSTVVSDSLLRNCVARLAAATATATATLTATATGLLQRRVAHCVAAAAAVDEATSAQNCC